MLLEKNLKLVFAVQKQIPVNRKLGHSEENVTYSEQTKTLCILMGPSRQIR